MHTQQNQNTQSFGELVEAVRHSRLVSPERLNEAVAEVVEAHAAPTADELGRRLQEQGLVTDWHRRMLRQGVDGGFFIGRYRLLDELGCGGMSSVFLGRHETWGKQAAIKVLQPRRAASRSHLERFLRESRTLAALDHSHIVRVLDCGCERGRYYLVMEFVEGPTIHDLVRRGGALAWRDAAHLAAQAAAGLHYAHGAGLVHRDVKPANILVSKEGGAKVADLGLARIAGVEGPSLTLDDGTVVGTVDYLAPEQALDSHNVDEKADVYSLGCTLFYMLAGRAPFPNGSLAQRLLKHQAVAPPVLHQMRPEIPLELSRLVERMMAKNRIDRPGMDEAAATLRTLARRTSKVNLQPRPRRGCVPAGGRGARRGLRRIVVRGRLEPGDGTPPLGRRRGRPSSPRAGGGAQGEGLLPALRFGAARAGDRGRQAGQVPEVRLRDVDRRSSAADPLGRPGARPRTGPGRHGRLRPLPAVEGRSVGP